MRHLVCLVAVCGWCASQSDLAVVGLMRGETAGKHHQVQLLSRTQVDTDLDLVVVFDGPPGYGNGVWWGPQTKLGLFLQSRADPGMLYKIAVESGPNYDCGAVVERVTATDVVISCTPEKGHPGPYQKFVYDVRAKALVKRVAEPPFPVYRILTSAEKTVFIGSDFQRLIAIEYKPGQEPPFELLRGEQADRWSRRVATSTSTSGLGADHRTEISVAPKELKLPRFGPDNQFTLSDVNKHLLVMEGGGVTAKRFQLPASTYDEFSRARPGRAKNGYTREATTISEAMGPWQVANGTLWFAKSFCDGEGLSGVGGFGYFDSGERKYKIYSPVEIRDFSVTAMLVDPDAVWLALAGNGEWGSTGGGVLRYDRATQQVSHLRLREIVGEIARSGDHLVMATAFGVAMLEGEKLRRFFVDQTTDGRLRMVEGLPSGLLPRD